ncbi:hypothetical protein Rs2_41003 [Raphanus sativus]|nr:hypothetical protein Rs2_41003 [Raphanus sativus]
MDVARVLVEVDLTKPLPNKISFQDRVRQDVLVTISYPWLPPRCLNCSRWGHSATDCQTMMSPPVEKSQADTGNVDVENDTVVLEGFASKDATERTSTEIVTKLLTELESISGKENLSGKSLPSEVKAQLRCEHVERPIVEDEWSLVTTKSGGIPSPGKDAWITLDWTSPNGFQILQDVREEGEIPEDEDDVVSNSKEEVVAGRLGDAATTSCTGTQSVGKSTEVQKTESLETEGKTLLLKDQEKAQSVG